MGVLVTTSTKVPYETDPDLPGRRLPGRPGHEGATQRPRRGQHDSTDPQGPQEVGLRAPGRALARRGEKRSDANLLGVTRQGPRIRLIEPADVARHESDDVLAREGYPMCAKF